MGVKTIPLHTRPKDGFTPSVDHCRDLITSKTKAIVLVTPNNPTGAIYSPELLSRFAALAKEKNVALVIDETYRDFIVTGSAPHTLFSNHNPPWRNSFIHLFSFSKAYCLPGHRLGAIIASPHLLSQTKSILDTIQICAPCPPQLALAPLLKGLRPWVDETARAVHARHLLFKEMLPERWKVGSQGGYFACVKHPFLHVRARDVCRRLAEEMGVVTLPCSFFSSVRKEGVEGDDGTVDWTRVQRSEEVGEVERWIRFSVANVNDEEVMRVCERLGRCEGDFGWTLGV
jgi:aspartate/methionine/tyrosine aminotransferase